MKVIIKNKPIDIVKEAKKIGERSNEIDELYFYRNMYNALDKISLLYKDGYNALKVYQDITTNLNESASVREVIELTALEVGILSLLVGLNRESLQEANSNTSDRSLFQYLNYESGAKVKLSPYKTVSAHEYSKMLCKQFNFNPSHIGPFPYMLSILKTDNRTRPYDYVTKMRNALQHAEYFQKKGEVNTVHITNRDDDGNLTFEGDLLLWSYRNFVEDFYGLGLGVADDFEIYDIPKVDTVKDKKELTSFLKEVVYSKVTFKKVPAKYKFSGKNGLFYELNQCFGLDAYQKKDVYKRLDELKKEGLEFNIVENNLDDNKAEKMVEYLEKFHKDELYNNKKLHQIATPIVKLVNCPNNDITNSLCNILRYIDMKKQYLILGEKPELSLFNEQRYDEDLKLSFQYALMLLRANLVSYAMECEKFERLDLSSIDLSGMNVYPSSEYNLRVVEDYQTNGDATSMHQYVVINTIRNAIAHGNDRLDIITGENREITLGDTFDNKHELYVSSGLDNFENILKNPCFNPNNIKVKETYKAKVLVK